MSAAPSLELPYRIRAARESDTGFITNAWRESFYVGAPAAQYADRDHYKREMGRVFLQLLPHAKQIIACDTSDDDTLIGFAVATGPELHYVYVRGGDATNMRHMGIARALVEALGPITSYTFRTLAGERRLRPRDRGWKYTPRWTL